MEAGQSAAQMKERSCRWRGSREERDEGEAAHQRGGREGMGLRERDEGETVPRRPLEFEVSPRSGFGSRERVGHRSMHIPNARIKFRNGSDP